MRRLLLAGVLAAGLGALAGGALPATGSAGGPSSEGTPSNGSSNPNSSPSCPSSNPPNEMQLMGGSPQSATLGSAFLANLQVALANSNGCPVTGVAGTPVTFTAPPSGPSGTFSGSGSRAVTVGADSQGNVAAPPFSANLVAGGYTVSAASAYGTVSFSLTNSAAGVPARLRAVSPQRAQATVLSRYRKPLQVEVQDASGAPLAGVAVSFTITPASGTNACGTTESATATFLGGEAQASATTDAAGIATSPPLSAGTAAGTFSASAALSGTSGSGGASLPAPLPLTFSLRNLPGRPRKLTAGVGASQSAALGARFPIPLAVSVTDAQDNPVPRALVTFAAPTRGASGSFSRHGRRVSVRSDTCGIAVAPAFSANYSAGGYAVRASMGHARAAFGLVNRGG